MSVRKEGGVAVNDLGKILCVDNARLNIDKRYEPN